MYEAHFGFVRRPFPTHGNGDFFECSPHCEILEQLSDSVRQGKSLALIGHEGSGKSTLARSVREILAGDSTPAKLVAGETITSESAESLVTGETLIVDDADALPPAAFDLLVSRAEKTQTQLLLIGKRRLEDNLDRDFPRIALGRLSAAVAESYIRHRLEHARSEHAIESPAISLLAIACDGNFRGLVTLCDHALRVAFRDRLPAVTRMVVEEAIAELGDDGVPQEREETEEVISQIESPFLSEEPKPVGVEERVVQDEATDAAPAVASFEVGAGIENQSEMRIFSQAAVMDSPSQLEETVFDDLVCAEIHTATPEGIPAEADATQDHIGVIDADEQELCEEVHVIDPHPPVYDELAEAVAEDDSPEAEVGKTILELHQTLHEEVPPEDEREENDGRFARLFSRLRKKRQSL